MLTTTLDFTFHRAHNGFRLDVHDHGTLELLTTTEGSSSSFFLNVFELKQLDFDSKDAEARVERLRAYGRKLYGHIFTPEISNIWSDYKSKNEFLILCIRTTADTHELEAIVWEALHDGHEFLAAGKKTTISRLPMEVAPRVGLPACSLPLKMLGLVSSPLDLPDHSRLQIEREQEILLEAINNPAGQGRIRADFEDEAKLEILESSLKTGYQILHFTGHGIAAENGGGLLLEDTHGKSRPTSVAEIQSLCRGDDSLRLVFLSGCQTATTIHVEVFSDMARGLLQAQIPAVIAMQFSISDEGAIKFAENLYTGIAAGHPLEVVVNAARRALLLSDEYYLQADAITPVLLTANGECLQVEEIKSSPTTEAPKIDFSFHLPLAQLGHGFYGRRKEYRQIREAMLRHNQRAIVVHGIGGIGKTALVSHVAKRLKQRFQGVYAFDCSSGTLTPKTVLLKLHEYFARQNVHELKQLLDQPELPVEVLTTHLAQILSKWSLLLIFDNYENQLERTDSGFRIADQDLRTFITLLIKTTEERTSFLFTSRYLFDLDDKRLGIVRSLPLQDLSRPEALSLMQKLPHLAPVAYSEKVRALDIFGGHPYALVTLDRYGSHQPLRKALEDSKLIHFELREFLAIDLNYSQLSESSRDLLNRLAAFKQSVPYDAAEWVIGKKVDYDEEFLETLFARARDEWPKEWEGHFVEADMRRMIKKALPERRKANDSLRAINELMEWGLLTSVQEDGQLRALSVHTLVREFCRDKQNMAMWREQLRDAAAFYTNSIKLRKGQPTAAEIWTEILAFELLMEAEDFNEAALLLFDADKLLVSWGFGRYLERQYSRLVNKLDSNRTAILLHRSGNLSVLQGDFDKALAQFKHSLEICEQADQQSLVAASLAQIGNIHYKRRKFDKALQSYERALAISEESDEYSSMCSTLHRIGMIYETKKEFEKAAEYYMRSLNISGRSGDKTNFAISVRQIGVLIDKTDDDDAQALDQYRQSLGIFEELNNLPEIVTTLNMIGDVYLKTKQYEKASESYYRSLKILEELGSHLEIAYVFQQIGTIHFKQGAHDKALEYSRRSLEIREKLNDRTGILASLHRIAMVEEHLGNFHMALDYYNRSFEIAKAFGDPKEMATPLMQMGLIYHRQDRFGKAGDCYDRSIRISKESDFRPGLARALHLKGMLFISVGRAEDAFRDLLASWKLFKELKDSDADLPISSLKILRSVWGERTFDAEWKTRTGEAVPEWLKS